MWRSEERCGGVRLQVNSHRYVTMMLKSLLFRVCDFQYLEVFPLHMICSLHSTLMFLKHLSFCQFTHLSVTTREEKKSFLRPKPVLMSTIHARVHNPCSCPQPMLMSTTHAHVQNPCSCPQPMLMSTTHAHVHNPCSCPQSMLVYTTHVHVHNPCSCPQTHSPMCRIHHYGSWLVQTVGKQYQTFHPIQICHLDVLELNVCPVDLVIDPVHS